MIVRAASLSVLPEPSIVFKAVDRPRIRIPFVEVLDFRCYPSGIVNAVLLVGSSKINQPLRCIASAEKLIEGRVEI